MVEMLYFSASWCGPCRYMAPIIEQLKSEGRSITKVDADENPELTKQHGVMGIPAFVFLKDGVPVKRIAGAREKWTLENEFRMVEDA